MHWADRKLCTYERSRNRGQPVSRCNIAGKLRFIHDEWSKVDTCKDCGKEFDKEGNARYQVKASADISTIQQD